MYILVFVNYISVKLFFKSRGEDGELKGIPQRYVELLSNAGFPQQKRTQDNRIEGY